MKVVFLALIQVENSFIFWQPKATIMSYFGFFLLSFNSLSTVDYHVLSLALKMLALVAKQHKPSSSKTINYINPQLNW